MIAAEHDRRQAALRAWAAGMHTTEAAAELLIRTGLADGEWIITDDNTTWFDAHKAIEAGGALSGGQRRVLRIAAALAADDVPVALGDAISGLDRAHVDLVLAAIAHASGSHQHSGILFDEDGTPAGFERLASLYPWPA